jgi:hypothetical protein
MRWLICGPRQMQRVILVVGHAAIIVYQRRTRRPGLPLRASTGSGDASKA